MKIFGWKPNIKQANADINLQSEIDRQAELIGSLQDKLFTIADATRNGKSGTARMVYRMTGRDHVAL
jgi:hypothetical protein